MSSLCFFIIGCSGEPITVVVEEEKSGMATEVVLGGTVTASKTNSQGMVDTTTVAVKPQPVSSPTTISSSVEKNVETPTSIVILSPTTEPVEAVKPPPVPTALPEPVEAVKPSSVPTALPEPVATTVVTPQSAAATPVVKEIPSPTPLPEASPTVTSVPASEPTAEPKTDAEAYPSSITVLALDSQERYEKHGFSLSTSGARLLVEGGRDLGVADYRQGMVAFQLGSSLALLDWSSDADGGDYEFLGQAYASLKNTNPNWSYAELNEGTLTVDGLEASYGAFAAGDDISDPDGFGLIAAWECPVGGRKFALSLTGMEPTVVQIRFRTLLDSFDCG